MASPPTRSRTRLSTSCARVSTGHGALRTTASTTEPVSMCSRSTRPCVPITTRSMSLAVAKATIATSGCPDVRATVRGGSEALRRRLPRLGCSSTRATGDSSSATFVAASACRRISSEPSRQHRSAATRSPACAGSNDRPDSRASSIRLRPSRLLRTREAGCSIRSGTTKAMRRPRASPRKSPRRDLDPFAPATCAQCAQQ